MVCTLTEWSGVIGFAIAIIVSILVWKQVLRRAPRNVDTSGDKAYDKIVISSILSRSREIPIAKVAEALKGQKIGEFSLSELRNNTRNFD